MQRLVAGLSLDERFSLIRQLGRGGMGEVWLAEDRQLKEQVALKILSSPDAPSEGLDAFVELLRQECRKARGLVHPNIVCVYDFHAGDGSFFISMQYVDGDSLAESRGKPFQVVVEKVLMVCDALEYAHRAGIIHRDVKSSNVLCDGNGVCYLTDFGIATAIAGDERFSDLRGGGSLPCMSPQQIAGEPAAVADDVYSLGSLLYELLSGQPLFHPGITAERICDEVPALLTQDGTNQQIPDTLVKVVRAMLEKSPERRPAGIGAVRSVLEEIRADYPATGAPGADAQAPNNDGVIRPVTRTSPVRRTATSETRTSATGLRAKKKKGASARLVYGGLGALLLVAAAVIFFLPKVVRDKGPVVIERAELRPETGEAPGADPGASLAQREIADTVLGELLVIDDRLRALGVELWGGTDWTDARQLAETGDDSYRNRDYAEALSNYRQALNLMELIEARVPEVLAAAMRDGRAALEAPDQEAAIQNFEVAIAIDNANQAARKGLERAMRLDEVVALIRRAVELEQTGDLAQARDAYQAVLAMDSDSQAAQDGYQRTRGSLAKTEYSTRMAAGFSALAEEDLPGARTEFRAALSVRPGNADATSALRQIDDEERLQRIITLQGEGKTAESREKWSLAVEKYSGILAIDDTVASAKQDLARSRDRLELHERLDAEIGKADRFNDDKVARSANQLLARARSVGNPGPILSGQIAELDRLLRIAATPVPVEFRSDNLTQVVIYKVGNLGTFVTRTLDLKPGGYVAVGSREGFRDVRRSFRVIASGEMPPIVLSCEEPI
jgi:tetratricopeptide (TPR) repeat protein